MKIRDIQKEESQSKKLFLNLRTDHNSLTKAIPDKSWERLHHEQNWVNSTPV